MPLIKSAKKKLRQDKKRTVANLSYKKQYKEAIKKAIAGIEGKVKDGALKKAYSAIDKATKKGIIHKNKAARLKSQVSKSKKST